MSDALRQTSSGYGQQITAIEQQIDSYERQIKEHIATKEDLIKAKAIVDRELDKLPKPKVPGPTEPPPSGTRATGG